MSISISCILSSKIKNLYDINEFIKLLNLNITNSLWYHPIDSYFSIDSPIEIMIEKHYDDKEFLGQNGVYILNDDSGVIEISYNLLDIYVDDWNIFTGTKKSRDISRRLVYDISRICGSEFAIYYNDRNNIFIDFGFDQNIDINKLVSILDDKKYNRISVHELIDDESNKINYLDISKVYIYDDFSDFIEEEQ